MLFYIESSFSDLQNSKFLLKSLSLVKETFKTKLFIGLPDVTDLNIARTNYIIENNISTKITISTY